jgi:hypothetical protein
VGHARPFRFLKTPKFGFIRSGNRTDKKRERRDAENEGAKCGNEISRAQRADTHRKRATRQL